MATTPQVSICIISYNTREMTLACLASVAAETRVPHEVIVVDNASTDGSAEAIAAQFPDVTLIKETTNHGFARAHEYAVPHATGHYVLLLNPDTLVLDGAIDKLLAFAAKRPKARIWGGRTLFADHSLNPSSAWHRQTLWTAICTTTGLARMFPHSALFNPEAYGGWDRGSEQAVDIVSGCFLLIERAFWQELDGFDRTFFMYGEEADLCLRAHSKGAAPRTTPDATIIHYGGASETVKADKLVRLLRAKIELINRHFPAATRALGVRVLRLWPWTRKVALGVLSKVTGREKYSVKRDIWAEVWTRRAEWKDGWREDEA